MVIGVAVVIGVAQGPVRFPVLSRNSLGRVIVWETLFS